MQELSDLRAIAAQSSVEARNALGAELRLLVANLEAYRVNERQRDGCHEVCEQSTESWKENIVIMHDTHLFQLQEIQQRLASTETKLKAATDSCEQLKLKNEKLEEAAEVSDRFLLEATCFCSWIDKAKPSSNKQSSESAKPTISAPNNRLNSSDRW